jgi:hypothetical protein
VARQSALAPENRAPPDGAVPAFLFMRADFSFRIINAEEPDSDGVGEIGPSMYRSREAEYLATWRCNHASLSVAIFSGLSEFSVTIAWTIRQIVAFASGIRIHVEFHNEFCISRGFHLAIY